MADGANVASTGAFSSAIGEYWNKAFSSGDVIQDDGFLSIALNPALDKDRRVMLLDVGGGQVRAALVPAIGKAIDLCPAEPLSVTELRARLADAGVVLHDPDFVFYKPENVASPPRSDAPVVRQLEERDRAAFAAFHDAASLRDREDAYVELDHWAVFGLFDQGRLASAASMYPWGGAAIADLGVLTLPQFRGRGYAQSVVRAIGQFARDRGYQPQYRCQVDNAASVALARATGFALFGRWEVIASGMFENGASLNSSAGTPS